MRGAPRGEFMVFFLLLKHFQEWNRHSLIMENKLVRKKNSSCFNVIPFTSLLLLSCLLTCCLWHLIFFCIFLFYFLPLTLSWYFTDNLSTHKTGEWERERIRRNSTIHIHNSTKYICLQSTARYHLFNFNEMLKRFFSPCFICFHRSSRYRVRAGRIWWVMNDFWVTVWHIDRSSSGDSAASISSLWAKSSLWLNKNVFF